MKPSYLITTLITAAMWASGVNAAPEALISQQIPVVASSMTATGQLASTNTLTLAISLPLTHTNTLHQLLADVYNPASPLYHHFLTPAQFTAQFGPSQKDYTALESFCQQQGLQIVGTHANRMLLDVRGNVKTIEAALHTQIQQYLSPDGRKCYAPTKAPTLNFNHAVLHIDGLNNLHPPQSNFHGKCIGHVGGIKANVQTKNEKPQPSIGSGISGLYLGADFRNLYAPNVSLNGTGQSIDLVQFDGYYANDITTYCADAGQTKPNIQNILMSGSTGAAGSNNGEVALDIEMCIAMAPSINTIYVYEGNGSSQPNDILNQIAQDDNAKQISSSWTWGTTHNATTEQILQEMALQGQTYFNAAGDFGAYSGGVAAPTDSPYVVSVGGTMVTTGSGGVTWSSATTWNANGYATGGGISTVYKLPSWQTNIATTQNGASTQYRNIPDVALVAYGVESIANNGSIYQTVGTSVAAPLWAGYMALINQDCTEHKLPPIGWLNPILYKIGNSSSYHNDFHDITTGCNTNSTSPTAFYAASGYDLCTGWGSPTGINTINDIMNMSNPALVKTLQVTAPTVIHNNGTNIVQLAMVDGAGNVITTNNPMVTISPIGLQTQLQFQHNMEDRSLNWLTADSNVESVHIGTGSGAPQGTNYLELVGDDNNIYDGYQINVSNTQPTQVSFDVRDMYPGTTGGYFVMGQGNARTNSIIHFRIDGTLNAMVLQFSDTSYFSTPYYYDMWDHIKFTINWQKKTVDFYVNNQLTATNLPFCNPNINSVAMIQLYNYTSYESDYDEIQVYQQKQSPSGESTIAQLTNGVWTGNVPCNLVGTNCLLTITRTNSTTTTGPIPVADLVTINGIASPAGSSTITGGGQVWTGQTVNLTNTPAAGWQFMNWNNLNTQQVLTVVAGYTNTEAIAYNQSAPIGLPSIISQPANTVATVGGSATFHIAASGSQTLAYQWQCNSKSINAATNESLTINNVTPSSGTNLYDCVVSSSAGSTDSQPAQIEVQPLFNQAPTMDQNGDFHLNVEGTPGKTATIYISTNLATWTPLETITFGSGTTTIIDSQHAARRFYKIELNP